MSAGALTGRTRHVWRTFGILRKINVRVFQVEKHFPPVCADSFGTSTQERDEWFAATPDDMENLREMKQ